VTSRKQVERNARRARPRAGSDPDSDRLGRSVVVDGTASGRARFDRRNANEPLAVASGDAARPDSISA